MDNVIFISQLYTVTMFSFEKIVCIQMQISNINAKKWIDVIDKQL